ncbi:MAG TPA: hypothetical protein VM942_01335 [Acidimicrobiales bacterium]|nr:hypothetical protein [Acidimicrobiales bacterium]
MSDQMSGVRDIEAPERDAFEQSLPVVDVPDDPPVEVLSGDLEVPEPDALEQRRPAPLDDEERW